MSILSRRTFLKHGVAGSAALPLVTIAGTKSSGKVLGANDKIRIAVVGLRGRGKAHYRSYANIDGVEVSHLVDIDSTQFEPTKKHLASVGAPEPQCVADIRRVLDDPNVDAISIATCNHTHSLYTIWGCQAGKDVYVEKPISHNMFEGRQCVEAARKYNVVVQHGTQQRSSQERANEIAAVQSGNYGKLLVSKGYCCKPRWSIGNKPVETPPDHVDFNLWLGPAPNQPYHANLVHYNWHWFWDFGNGDTGNQGVHEMDVARWAIPGATLPTRVWSLGGRFGYQDQGQTPNTHLSVYEYGDVLLVFETRGLVGKKTGFSNVIQNEYYTTEGMIQKGLFHPAGGGDAIPVEGGTPRQVTPGNEFGSFIAAVRSRRAEDCNADAETAHYSAALCHLGNISYRLGKQVPFNAQSQALGDNKQVVESLQTIQENCKAVGMDLTDATYQLGRPLEINPQTETIVGDDEASLMMTRKYRKPFEVPQDV